MFCLKARIRHTPYQTDDLSTASIHSGHEYQRDPKNALLCRRAVPRLGTPFRNICEPPSA
jgi:hypothetical protein